MDRNSVCERGLWGGSKMGSVMTDYKKLFVISSKSNAENRKNRFV